MCHKACQSLIGSARISLTVMVGAIKGPGAEIGPARSVGAATAIEAFPSPRLEPPSGAGCVTAGIPPADPSCSCLVGSPRLPLLLLVLRLVRVGVWPLLPCHPMVLLAMPRLLSLAADRFRVLLAGLPMMLTLFPPNARVVGLLGLRVAPRAGAGMRLGRLATRMVSSDAPRPPPAPALLLGMWVFCVPIAMRVGFYPRAATL